MTQLRLTVAQISVLVLRCEHTFGPSEEESVLFVPPLDRTRLLRPVCCTQEDLTSRTG